MSFRRDHITSNVESLGSIEEILEQSGEKYFLEDLRYLEGRDTRERTDLINNWLHQQELWHDKLPELIETVEAAVNESLPATEVLQYLEDYENFINTDIQNSLILSETLVPEERDKILEAVQKLQERRGRIFREIAAKNPQFAEFLRNHAELKALEDYKITSEMNDEQGT